MDELDLELLDFLQAAYENFIDNYTIYYTLDYKTNDCSYREFCWVSKTKEEDEPLYLTAHDCSDRNLYLTAHDCGGRITNKTGHTPSDLLIQLANISIDILLDSIECMEVKDNYKKVAVA